MLLILNYIKNLELKTEVRETHNEEEIFELLKQLVSEGVTITKAHYGTYNQDITGKLQRRWQADQVLYERLLPEIEARKALKVYHDDLEMIYTLSAGVAIMLLSFCPIFFMK